MTYTTYSRSGPFTDNSPPGISASLLNAIESFLLAGWFDSSITSNGAGALTTSGLTVNGTSSLGGNSTVSGTLVVTGDVTMSGSGTGLSVSHNVTISGTLNANGGISFPNGSLTTMRTFGSIALTTSQATYNHNLGVVPDIILLCPDGTSSTARTWQVDYGTLTSSTFKATGGSSFNAVGVAIKF